MPFGCPWATALKARRPGFSARHAVLAGGDHRLDLRGTWQGGVGAFQEAWPDP